MANKKMRNCKPCNAEISAKGKVVCPNCGAVNKKPIYKRFWFIALVLIILFAALGSCGDDNNESTAVDSSAEIETTNTVQEREAESTKAPIEPIVVTADTLYDELESNALKASNTYKDQYVELTGKLTVIDASGSYFALSPMNDDFSILSVRCDIRSEYLDKVANFEEGQEITVLGTISDVGEVLGYSLAVDTIVTEVEISTEETTENAGIIIATTDELIDLLNQNALKASQTYKGKEIELTGKLSVIDASGDYFSLSPMHDDFSFINVLCYIDDEHLDTVMEFTDGQEITVTGKITNVGEILGYTLDVETIK